MKTYFPQHVALQVYYALIYSRLSYSVEIYGTAKRSTLRPLQIMQNRIIKILTGKHRRYPTNQLYSELELLQINEIHEQNQDIITLKLTKVIILYYAVYHMYNFVLCFLKYVKTLKKSPKGWRFISRK